MGFYGFLEEVKTKLLGKRKKCVFKVTDSPQVKVTDPDFFVPFWLLQLILLAEKCFQFQVYFCCNLC